MEKDNKISTEGIMIMEETDICTWTEPCDFPTKGVKCVAGIVVRNTGFVSTQAVKSAKFDIIEKEKLRLRRELAEQLHAIELDCKEM